MIYGLGKYGCCYLYNSWTTIASVKNSAWEVARPILTQASKRLDVPIKSIKTTLLSLPVTGDLPGSRLPGLYDLGVFFNGDHVLSHGSNQPFIFPLNQVFLKKKDMTGANLLFVGQWQKQNLFAVVLDRSVVEKRPNFQWTHGRDVLKIMDPATSNIICRSKQLLHWHLTTLYCGSCGNVTTFSPKEIAKCCTGCKKLIFPSTFPAIIVLIVRDKHVLLARSPYFPVGMYSTLAGFVGPGESLESTVHRETEEEVGVKVKEISYFGSQPWPFPNSFMVGFQAKYESGEIRIDRNEIEDAKWYPVSNLPLLPPTSSISRLLIDQYVAECNKD